MAREDSAQQTFRKLSKRCVNKYIPEYVPENLKWYERNGLLTDIDQLKYSKFTSNPDEHIKNSEFINFDMIHARCWVDKQSMPDRHCQTVVSSDVVMA